MKKDKKKSVLYPVDNKLVIKIMASDALIKKDVPLFIAGFTLFGTFMGFWSCLWFRVFNNNLTYLDVATVVPTSMLIFGGAAAVGSLGAVGYNRFLKYKYKKKLENKNLEKTKTEPSFEWK